MRYLPLTAPLRAKYQYCNLMFVTIAHLIETLTSQGLGSYISRKILEPLGMKHTYFSPEEAEQASENMATGYSYSDGGFRSVKEAKFSEIVGAGFIVSSVLDYALWIRSQLSEAGPISKKQHKELRRARMISGEEEDKPFTGLSSYALGWDSGIYRGYKWISHSGGMLGYGTQLHIFPTLNWGVVTMANTAGSSNFAGTKLLFWALDEKLGIPEEERFDWNKKFVIPSPSMSNVLTSKDSLNSQRKIKLPTTRPSPQSTPRSPHLLYHFHFPYPPTQAPIIIPHTATAPSSSTMKESCSMTAETSRSP